MGIRYTNYTSLAILDHTRSLRSSCVPRRNMRCRRPKPRKHGSQSRDGVTKKGLVRGHSATNGLESRAPSPSAPILPLRHLNQASPPKVDFKLQTDNPSRQQPALRLCWILFEYQPGDKSRMSTFEPVVRCIPPFQEVLTLSVFLVIRDLS